MQFQVPQFIDTEDKIAGPLTIRQFVYIAIAGGVSALLFFALQTWVWVIITIPLLGFAAALSFAKVNGRPFSKFMGAALGFYWKPQTYVWQPETPKLPKTEEAVKRSVPSFSVEKIFSGASLKKAWGSVQTGSKVKEEPKPKPESGRYQVFQKTTGENDVARRIDYR